MRSSKLITILLTALLFLAGASLCPAQNQEPDKTLVQGDGVSVTTKEMDLLQARLKSIFKASHQSDYCMAVLKNKLFASEAKNLKLDENPKIQMLLDQVINEQLALVYQQYLLSNYTLSDDVIESFYFSHTDELMGKDGDPLPLNDDLKKLIKQRIMTMKRADIMKDKFEELKKQHNVRILDSICKPSEEQ